MDRTALDTTSRELFGRPLTDDEAAFVANACSTMRLGEGDILVSLLIVYASLMSFLAKSISAAEASRSLSSLLRRHRGTAIGGLGIVAVLVTGAFALGQGSVADRSQRDIVMIMRWALSPEGQRARRLSDLGFLQHLDDCSIPGWSLQGETCMPGPDPASGSIRGIRIRPTP